MAWAAETGVWIMPSGAGCWLGAGGWGRPTDVVLTTLRMNQITHYEPRRLDAPGRCRPGFG